MAKKPVKGAAKAKKAAPKKVAPKKAASKKTAPKKAVPKKAAPKKAAPKKEPPKKEAPKKPTKRVPLRIVRKPVEPVKREAEEVASVDTKAAVALAQSIALARKRAAAKAEQEKIEREIRLTKRPTTRTQGRDTAKFPQTDLREFRKRLLDARVRALGGIEAMRSTGFNETDDHEADGGDGTNQTLRLQALGQMGNIKRTIQQIDEALHRIDDGSYGVCTSCGQLIRKPRLINQPFVLTCMECQSALERNPQ